MLNFTKAYDLMKVVYLQSDKFEALARQTCKTLIYLTLYSSVKYFSDTIGKPQRAWNAMGHMKSRGL